MNGEIFDLDLAHLRYLQISRHNVRSVFDRFCRAPISRSAASLRCIHIHYPILYYYVSVGNPVLTIIPLDECTLPNLRCLEVRVELSTSALQHFLAWLSGIVLSPTSSFSSRELKVSVLAVPNSREDLIEYFALWEQMRLGDRWPNLTLESVAVYAAIRSSSDFPGDGMVEVVPLGSYGGGEAQEYHSLWEDCPCLGWRTG
jgi:hypothetical protein